MNMIRQDTRGASSRNRGKGGLIASVDESFFRDESRS